MKKTRQRRWMIEAREARGVDRQQMGMACGCSEELIYLLEETGTVTHPEIAADIARYLGVGVDRYNELVHKSRRAMVIPAKNQPKPENGKSGLYVKGWI